MVLSRCSGTRSAELGHIDKQATQTIAEFASQLTYNDLSPAVIKHIKLCLLDTVGCGLFGTTLPWGRIVQETVGRMGGVSEATIWGSKMRVPAANAALANGTMIHGFELDDLHRESILHPGSVVVAAALAQGEARADLSGAEFVAAVVVGYEVGIRAGMALGTSHLLKGFHPTGTVGAVGAAAAAGKVLGLRPELMAHAISIGATQGAGLMAAQYGSMVKRMHAGRASQSGVYGALLAQAGFTGIPDVLEAAYGGFCSTLSDAADLSALTQNLGQVFETVQVGFKRYSCCGSCHTAVEAIRRLRSRGDISADRIERIVVETTTATLLHVGWPYEPTSITAAQMNMPFCVAVAALDGDAFVEQFTEDRIREPRICDLARRVEVRSNVAFDDLGPGGRHVVRVKVLCRDGQSYEEGLRTPKGSPENPLTPEEVVEKYFQLAGRAVRPDRAREILEVIMAVEEIQSVKDLTDLLR